MTKIPFEDGQLAQAGYVMIDGVKHEIVEPVYNGAIPVSADILNQMQDNVEQAVNSIGASDIDFSDGTSLQDKYNNKELGGLEIPKLKMLSIEQGASNWETFAYGSKTMYAHTIQDDEITEEHLIECLTAREGQQELAGYHIESFRGGFKVLVTEIPNEIVYLYIKTQKVLLDNKTIFAYRDSSSSLKILEEGKKFTSSIRLSFNGTATLINKTTNKVEIITTGAEINNNGEYKIVVLQSDGIFGKVNFTINIE